MDSQTPLKRTGEQQPATQTDEAAVHLAKRLKVTAIADCVDTGASATEEKRSEHHCCMVGQAAPNFNSVAAVMADGSISAVSLSQFRGRYVLLAFYPADFTFVCPTEITSLSDRVNEFTALDCDVMVCSTDSEFVHHSWRQQARDKGGVGAVAVPMLADRTRAVSRSYGVLCEEEGRAFRGLFIIDREQVLRVAQVYDMPVGRSVDEALRLVSAIKFADENGQVCPANWHAGDAGIVPDIQQSKAFFSNQ
ncbi:Peroxiredoxin-1 [Coemansia thaxteri]|nr:Peroxiredoxin-1 [Coemansia thaxteri]KAJ2485214.1 Peroxiredoxin-1 [Coemansia sp. RSA 2320]